MDLTSLAAVVFISFQTWVFPAFEGTYIYDHQISLNGYNDQASCEDDEGTWSNGLCLFPATDEVSIFEGDQGNWVAEISTTGENAHECTLSGAISALDAKTLRVVSSPDDQSGVPSCELTVRALDDAYKMISVEVNTPDECAAYCGANVSLDISAATRLEVPEKD